jgi:hypothetical protein
MPIRSLVVLLLTAVACAAAVAEKTLAIRDVTGRAWGPEVVSFRVKFDQPVRIDKLTLTDEAGKTLPVQVESALHSSSGITVQDRISFLASVPANGSARWSLGTVPLDAPPPAPVTVERVDGCLELRNETVALRLAAPEAKTFAPPVPAAALPGPFAGFRGADGVWVGGSRLVTARTASAYTAKIVAAGPVYASVVYEYRFSPKGVYRVTVRLDQGAPLARVEEEFDAGELTDGRDYLAITTGTRYPTLDDLDQYVVAYPAGTLAPRPATSCTFSTVAPWDMFGGRTFLPLEAKTNLGLLVLHSGAWRHPHNALPRLRATTGQPAVLELPFSCYGVLRPFNPFDTAEDDPGKPDSYGRRAWGLTLAPGNVAKWRLQYGFIGLDRYKEWVLDWSDAAPPQYPATYVTAKETAALKAGLAANPYKDTLNKLYIINPTDANGANSLKTALGWLDNRLPQLANTPGSSFRMAQYDDGIVPFCDDALAWPNLPAEKRQLLRAKIAAICYLYADPDFNPRGLGDHLGNPNMPINRYMGFPQYLQLIPGHPLYGAWLQDAVRYTAWKLADHTSPYGAWREEQGYQQAAVPFIADALLALDHAGKATPAMLDYVEAIHRYMLAVLSPPDLNDRGIRYCEGTGNGVRSRGDSMPHVASLFRARNPEFASQLMWAWEAMGKSPGGHGNLTSCQWLGYDPSITPKQPADLPGAFLPGFGATSRAHFGTPGETFLLFRQGHNASHFDMDQGSFKLYAWGEQVLPNSSLGYNSAAPAATPHGFVTFGDGEAWINNHGRTDSMVVDYAYLQSVDYLLGRQHFDGKSGIHGALKSPVTAPFDWYREFMVMKSRAPEQPSYLVLRDTFRGARLFPTHWYCWLLGKPDDITVTGNRVTVKTPQGNLVDLVFANREQIAPTFTWKATAGSSGCGFPPTGATLMQVDGAAGQDYVVVIYPRKAGMRGPDVFAPDPNTVIVGTDEGQDRVYWGSAKDSLCSFQGRCGAVRLNGEYLRFISTAGTASVKFRDRSWQCTGNAEEEYRLLAPPRKKTITTPWPPALALPGGPPGSVAKQVAPGIIRYTGKDGFAYQFASMEPLDFHQDGVKFRGYCGMVIVTGETVRLLMLTTWNQKLRDDFAGYESSIGYKDLVVRGEGPFDLTFTPATATKGGEVTGVADGRARVLEMTLPQNLLPKNCVQKAMALDYISPQNDGPVLTGIAPTLYLNGRQWQVGYYDRGLALPLFAGKNDIRLTRFYIPPLAPVVKGREW